MIGHPGTRAAPGWRLPAVWLLAGVVAVHASAASAAAQAVGDRKWEVEVSGGGEFSIRPVDGAALPIEAGRALHDGGRRAEPPRAVVVLRRRRRAAERGRRGVPGPDRRAADRSAGRGARHGTARAACHRRRDEPPRDARPQPAFRGSSSAAATAPTRGSGWWTRRLPGSGKAGRASNRRGRLSCSSVRSTGRRWAPPPLRGGKGVCGRPR